MSDAKAKAEARRAKILARDASNKRTVSAVMDIPEEEVDLNLPIGPTTPKERPLAARRRLVSSKAAEAEDKASTADTTNTTPDADSKSNNSTENEEKKDLSLKLPPKKTLEEIEKEVAENTAKFDENTLGTKKSAEEAQSEERKQLELVAEKAVQKYSLDASSLMRLMRVLFIFIMAFYAGYLTVQASRQEALKIAQLDAVSTNTLEDEFGTQYSSSSSFYAESISEERTWGQYFQQKLTSQIECPVSAVVIAWYLSRALAPALTAQFTEKKKPTKPLEMLMEFLTTGINAYVEGVYTVLGEICLHLCLLVISVVFFTIYFTPAEVQSTTSSVMEL